MSFLQAKVEQTTSIINVSYTPGVIGSIIKRTGDKGKGLSRMRGNSHVRFLGGWRVVTPSGYPVLPGTASSPPWWGQKRSIGRCAFAPTSAPQGAGNGTGCAALRPCRGTHPSPARRNESVAGGAAHAVKAKPSATLRVARKKRTRQP